MYTHSTMPYAKKTRKPYAKKARKPARRAIAPIPRTMPVTYGFPQTYPTMLKYVDTYPTESVSSVAQQRAWNLNSMYDPDRTGGGHQPTYFDQLTERYSTYRVMGCKVTLTITNLNASYPIDVAYIATSSQGATPSADPITVSQNNGGSKLYSVSSEGSNNQLVITKYFDMSKVFGVPKTSLRTLANYSGSTGNFGVGSNPSHVAELYLNVDSPTNASVSYITRIEMVQYGYFEDPKVVADS